jgi:hypothetical protein
MSYRESGSCVTCGYGVLEFTDETDDVPRYTHGIETPISERFHVPQIDERELGNQNG